MWLPMMLISRSAGIGTPAGGARRTTPLAESVSKDVATLIG
jgi:hypothetical protein